MGGETIRRRIEEAYDEILEQTRQNQEPLIWESIRSVEELGRVRMDAMQEFLSDYPNGVAQGRYVDASLPVLPFEAEEFDLAICSHLLFLYSAQLGEAFHRAALPELIRIAKEVRVFPLLALGGVASHSSTPASRSSRKRGTRYR
jgi:hypothetical protein